MTDRQLLVEQIVRHEGLRLHPYVDSVGIVTIGVGRNLTDVGISSQEAYLLLDHDLDDAIIDLASFPWFTGLGTIRQRALIDLRFNLGPTRFRTFRRMLAAVAAGDYPRAADEMRDSKWATQVHDRAIRLAWMMETGEALDAAE
jgi:lysozyme